jgi:hypothetical protein
VAAGEASGVGGVRLGFGDVLDEDVVFPVVAEVVGVTEPVAGVGPLSELFRPSTLSTVITMMRDVERGRVLVVSPFPVAWDSEQHTALEELSRTSVCSDHEAG